MFVSISWYSSLHLPQLKVYCQCSNDGLYNRSVMAAILDICKLANFQTQTGLSTKVGSEKKSRKSDEYWQQESIYVDLKYGNKSMAAILNMQISWFSNSARIIIRACWEKNSQRLDKYWRLEIFELKQDHLSERVQKKMAKIEWILKTGELHVILNMQISPWRQSWICKLADFRTWAG